MKKLLLVIFLIIFIFLVKIPKYNELNNLIVIDKMTIDCDGEFYHVKFREVIPRKDDNGINYKYNYYEGDGKSFRDITQNINKKKLFYIDGVKKIDGSCDKEKIKFFLKNK